MNLVKLLNHTAYQTNQLEKVCGRIVTERNPKGSLRSFRSKFSLVGVNAIDSTVTFASKDDSTFTQTFKYELVNAGSSKQTHHKFTAKLV